VERIILPDATIALDYILNLFYNILRGLVVNRERMLANMKLSKGLFFSSKALVILTERGMPRDKAYDLVQRCAMESWNTGREFPEVLLSEPEVRKHLSPEEVEKLFDPWEFLKHRDYIFEKVFG